MKHGLCPLWSRGGSRCSFVGIVAPLHGRDLIRFVLLLRQTRKPASGGIEESTTGLTGFSKFFGALGFGTGVATRPSPSPAPEPVVLAVDAPVGLASSSAAHARARVSPATQTGGSPPSHDLSVLERLPGRYKDLVSGSDDDDDLDVRAVTAAPGPALAHAPAPAGCRARKHQTTAGRVCCWQGRQ